MNLARVLILSIAVLLFPNAGALSSDSGLGPGPRVQVVANDCQCHTHDTDPGTGAIHHHYSHAQHSHHTLFTSPPSPLRFYKSKETWLPRDALGTIQARLADINRPPRAP
jgi:hypothetical protein